MRDRSVLVVAIAPEAGCVLARVGMSVRRLLLCRLAIARRSAAIAVCPWYSSGDGGMLYHALSASSATTESMSSATQASAKRRTSSRSPSESGSGARCRGCAPCSWSIVERARLSAPLTESSLESSMPATSAAWKPSTSRSNSAARWRRGKVLAGRR